MVQPEHKGRCPTCKSFLQANTISRKHPINVSKRAAILADLLVEFKPTTTMATATCEHLAATLERLNNARPGSVDWTRLISASQTLAAALRGPEVRPPDLSFMTLAQLEARSLELAAECRVAASQPEPVVAPTAVVEVPLVPADEVQATLVEAPLPTCAYCGNRPCVGPSHDAYRTLHYSDPVEVERRDREATRVMFAQLGKPSPLDILYPGPSRRPRFPGDE